MAPGTACVNLPKLFRTTAFRVALLYAALFGFSGLAALAFVYWTTTSYLIEQTDTLIRAEMDVLHETYQHAGLDNLRSSIMERSSTREESDRIYLLADQTYTPIAGNLPAWPATLKSDGWSLFILDEHDKDENEHHQREARTLSITLPGQVHLLIGRDLHEREELRGHTLAALLWALGIMLVLALAGGAVLSRGVLRRIEHINRTSREIMAGHFEQRVPLSGSGDEFDQLAQNLNLMLERIERLMRGLREVADNVAHDMRSPLTRLRNRLEHSQRERQSEGEFQNMIEQTLRDIDGLLNTFNALLSIAQLEAGARRGDWGLLDVGILAHDAAELYQPLVEEHGGTLSVNAGAGLMVQGSRELLSQALSNLLDNAIKYTSQGSNIQVSTVRAGESIELCVADNGPGIPAEARERVLERFVRLDSSRHQPGSGLGLSLVHAVAQLHNASLNLDDNHPGLKVTLRIPAAT